MGVLKLYRDFKTAFRERPHALEKPIVIQLPINDICNARCQMCNIWQQKRDHEISPEELTHALSSDLFSNVQTVGLNGGEPTLRRDLEAIGEALFQTLPRLRRIALITNAIDVKKVARGIDQLAHVTHRHGGSLDTMVSLDGVGDVHDNVRGKPGNFESALEIIEIVRTHEWIDHFSAACTVIRENVFHVHDLLEFAIARDIPIKFRLGIPHRRLYTDSVSEPFDLTLEERYHFANFIANVARHYEPSRLQQFFYESLIAQLMYGAPRAAGCDWQHRGVTLTSRGELLYCAVESDSLGSAIDEDAETLYFGRESHLQEIVSNKCDDCTHDYLGLPTKDLQLRDCAERALRKLHLSVDTVKHIPPLNAFLEWRRRRKFARRMQDLGVELSQLKTPSPAPMNILEGAERVRALCIGWYGTETLGDKAILAGVVQGLLMNLDDVTVDVASLEPYITEATTLQMPELSDIRVYALREALERVEQYDLVVFAGGPIMALDELAEMLAVFQKASLSGIPTLVAGCGVGPRGSTRHNRAIRHVLEHASERIYRDQRSRDIAASLGVDVSNDLVAQDPAFYWLDSRVSESESTDPDPNAPRTLILGLRDWPAEQYAFGWKAARSHETRAKFEQAVIGALETLVQRFPRLKILPFPMCTNAVGGDDRWFYRRLFRDHALLERHLDLSCLGAELTPDQAVSYFHSASAALTMRFHALVFALSAGLPTVTVDYTLGGGKVQALAAQYGVSHQSLDLIDEAFLVEELTTCLENHTDRSPQYLGDEFGRAMASVLGIYEYA